MAAATKPVSKQLETLEKEIRALRGQVREVENGLSLNKVVSVLVLVGMCWGLALGAEGYFQSRKAYLAIINFLPGVDKPVDQKVEQRALDMSPVKKGDKVAGLTVTSTYRSSDRPNHNGVDVGGPVGTPYFAPAAVTVRCFWDTSGGGQVAEFQHLDLRWQLLHLKQGTCRPGAQQPGAVIGELGNTGRSTGPHLHLQLRNGQGFIEPKRGHLLSVLQPPQHPQLGDVAALIAEFEGFHPTPYWDYQQWTWGYGTKAPGKGGSITQEQAKAELGSAIAAIDAELNRMVRVPITANQRAALTSLGFNVGTHALGRSRLMQRLNAGDTDGAAAEFDRWVNAGGKRLPGLVNRRAKEKAIFLGG